MVGPCKILSACLLIVGSYQIGDSVWIYGKALIAQALIERSWLSQNSSRPWPWADTKPVAKLAMGEERFIVLQGAHGHALSFGPGLVNPDFEPEVTVVIAAHRDTHFRNLRNLAVGDAVELETKSGQVLRYEVSTINVIDTLNSPYLTIENTPELKLVTCYPFDSVSPGGTLRYVVTAFLISRSDAKKRGASAPVGFNVALDHLPSLEFIQRVAS